MKSVILMLGVAMCLGAQEDQDSYFTGTLVENSPDHVKVSRVLQGKAEERAFHVTARTKIEGGRLRLRERVTVRYVSDDENDTAILVIVRQAATQPRKQK